MPNVLSTINNVVIIIIGIWNNEMSANNLTQLVEKPTRVTSTSSTTIDHIYTHRPAIITNIQILSLSISDHFPVCFTWKFSSNSDNWPLHPTIKYRSYKHFNDQLFLNDLGRQPWCVIDIYDDPGDSLDCL